MNKQTAGSILWLSAIQFYAVQAIVAKAWPFPYSISLNNISDLGNTVCSPHNTALVCSPLHALMNFSFVILGLSIIGGAYLLRTLFQDSRLGLAIFVIGGGIGTMAVGLVPENSVAIIHGTGAFLSCIFGNLSLILLGSSLPLVPRRLSRGAGVIGVAGALLYASGIYLGLGIGGMERIAAYPLSVWMIGISLYFLLRPRQPLI